jgi:ABC-type Na+ efflux pump permease subunit
MRAVVEPKENGSVDEEAEEKVSSSSSVVADAVQSAEKAFEMKDATPAVETTAAAPPKAAMQAMMCVLLFLRFVLFSPLVMCSMKERERERKRRALLVCFFFH